MKKIYKKLKFNPRYLFLFTVLLLISSVSIWWMVKNEDRKMRNEFLQHAKMLAKAFTTEQIAGLSGNEKDILLPDYKQLKKIFFNIKMANDKCRFIYLLGINPDKKIFFFLDNELPDSKDYSQPGEIYQSASQELNDLFKIKKAFVEGPSEDEWGIWVSALVPIINPVDNKVIAVFGIDMEASTWELSVFGQIALPAGLIILLFIVSVLAARYLKIQERVRESERKLKTLFSAMIDVVIVCDSESRIIFVAPTNAPQLYKSIDEIIGKTLFEIFPQTQAEFFQEKINQTIVTQKTQQLSYKLIIDEKEVWFEASLSPLSANSVMLVARDITERKKAEKKLFENEELFRKVIMTLPDLIIRTDISGTINFVNENALSTYSNLTADDILGKNMLSFISKKDLPRAIENTKMMFERPLGPQEYLISLENKIFIECEINGDIVLDASNTPIGMVYVIRNTTERKISEMELIKAKEKAEESDRLKSAFLANLSHEIRTPMNGIVGFLHLLKEPELPKQKKEKYLESMQKSANRLLKTINDIIEISKIESNQVICIFSELNINSLISEILTNFSLEAKIKGLEFLCKINLTHELFIKTDPELFKSILINLLDNAIKFTHKGFVEFGYTSKNRYLEFYIRDTGIGIPISKQNDIFERFIQVDNSPYSRNYEGSGLGLPISKAYVEILGGKIQVESTEKLGTAFYFTLPYNPVIENINKNTEHKNVNEHKNLPKKLKILIAEDDEISLSYLKIIVSELTDNLLFAGDGQKAVDLCKKYPDIDIVLMDIKLPVLDGIAATKMIREFNKKIIIIAQTAYALHGDKERVLAAGCNDYIAKPTNDDEIKMIISKYI